MTNHSDLVNKVTAEVMRALEGRGSASNGEARAEEQASSENSEVIDMSRYRSPVLTEKHMRGLHELTSEVVVPDETVITPKARELAKERGVSIKRGSVVRVSDIAKMIDHSLLHPTMTDEDCRQGCKVAKEYKVASVCVKPYAVKMAAEELAGSDVRVGTVIGFPHGNSSVEIKVKETEAAITDGAVEIDMVVNIGKVMAKDWSYLEREVKAVADACHGAGAIVKVIFENDYIDDDEYIIELCKLCERAGADYVKTSSGYGFIKGQDGKYSYDGATEADLKIMRANVSEKVKVKAAGGIRTLDDALMVRKVGCARFGATATQQILDEARKRGFPE